MYEIFEELLKKYNVTAYRVSKETGVGQSTFTDWKKGRSVPKLEKLQKIADYFGVSIDYLMTGREVTQEFVERVQQESQKEWEPTLTEKDEKDIQKRLEATLNQLDSDSGLMYSGEVLDDETRELLKASLETTMKTAKLLAKKKYTPDKYKK